MPDHLVRGLAAEGTIAAVAAVTSATVEDARRRHAAAPTATAALGRLLSATVMLGAGLKEGQRLTMRVLADGPLGGMIADGNGHGEVRGYAANPSTDLPLTPARKLNVGEAVGSGTLHVTRDLGLRFPYHGSVPLISGEIGEDVAHFLLVSEQVPSVVALGVLVAPDGRVIAAGGYILRVLPGAPPGLIRWLEERVAVLPPVSQLVSSHADPAAMLRQVVGDQGLRLLDQCPVTFRCRCSPARVEAVLVALGHEEVSRLLAEQGRAEATCRFCGNRYVLGSAEVEALFATLRA